MEWINVKDRFPEKEGFYMTCRGQFSYPRAIEVLQFIPELAECNLNGLEGYVGPGFVVHEYSRLRDEWYYDPCYPEYWMPVPEPPKEFYHKIG